MTKHPTPETNTHSSQPADPSAHKPAPQNQSSAAQPAAPDRQAIAARAYQKYLQSGDRGNSVDNWLKAEQELKAELQAQAPPSADKSNPIRTAAEADVGPHVTLQ